MIHKCRTCINVYKNTLKCKSKEWRLIMDNKDYFENRPVTMNPKNNLLEIRKRAEDEAAEKLRAEKEAELLKAAEAERKLSRNQR